MKRFPLFCPEPWARGITIPTMVSTVGPWEKWVPGVLNPSQIQELFSAGLISGKIEEPEGSAFDLTIADADAWEMTEGAVKPNGGDYVRNLQEVGLLKPIDFDKDKTLRLEVRKTYLLLLNQFFKGRTRLADAKIHGQATAKSSLGRLDVLARFILDGMTGYEDFTPDALKQGNGTAYLEVTPLSFPIRVKAGTSLSQLRLFYGQPSDVELRGASIWQSAVVGNDGETLTLNLEPDYVGEKSRSPAVAFTTVKDVGKGRPEIRSWERGTHPPCESWRLVPPSAGQSKKIQLNVGEFYILRSKERLRLPPGVAAYCRATDETIGEMRIHYAGFVHPYFGFERDDNVVGTPLIFEVRGHDFEVTLRHGETMARLSFYRMSKDSPEPKNKEYNKQELKLSGVFASWPAEIRLKDDGSAEAV